MAMKMILALLLVPSVLAFDASKLTTKESMLDFASQIKGKSTESEHGILKTLLDERSNWHPQAAALLQAVDKRDAADFRRLNGRRLAGSQVGGATYCDGGDEAACSMQVDAQCKMCKWDYSCDINKCDDLKNEQDCCANPMGVPTGCLWQKTSYGTTCREASCEMVIRDENFTTNAAKYAACNNHPNCMGFCGGSDERVSCEPKVVGKTCTCPKVDSFGMTIDGEADQECTTGGPAPTDAQVMAALGALSTAMSPSCTAMGCAKCLSGDSCDAKKQSVTSDTGKCNKECSPMAQCASEAECMFCGPKASNATTCTPRVAVAAVHPSCGMVGAAIVVGGDISCDNGDSACCKGVCDGANTRCPSTCGDSYTCLDTAPASGAVHTSGTAIVGMIGAVIGMLY